MPGTLYVVATPIGNLEDVTLRALRTLREVSLIAAEDTRRTGRLLQHYSISTPTTSLHEHNERRKTPELIEKLLAGESIALVSDAGTPVVSDPGRVLVAAAHKAGIRVEPVPGPSAVLAALSASGIQAEPFVFLGFPPARPGERKRWLHDAAAERRTLVLYEAPHRIRDTLQDLLDILGDRQILVARELTKVHEQVTLDTVSGYLTKHGAGRGEYTLVVSPPSEVPQARPLPAPQDLAIEMGELTKNMSLSRRAAIKNLASKYGTSSREIFARLERAKISGS